MNMTLSSKYLSRNHQHPSSTAFKKGVLHLIHTSQESHNIPLVLSRILLVSYHIPLALSKISMVLSQIHLALLQIPLVSSQIPLVLSYMEYFFQGIYRIIRISAI